MSEVQETGGGRKKSFEPNLVPFIDLMSVLITFLLLTAVWTQVSMIQIGTSIYGKKQDSAAPPPPIPQDAAVVLKLDIRPAGYTLTVAKNIIQIPLVNGEFDDTVLAQNLTAAKQQYPNKKDGAIAMADDMPYERLIKAMDVMLAAEFPQISILTGGPN